MFTIKKEHGREAPFKPICVIFEKQTGNNEDVLDNNVVNNPMISCYLRTFIVNTNTYTTKKHYSFKPQPVLY